MNAWRAAWMLLRTQVLQWWREPRHALVSVALSAVFLMIAHYLLIVYIGTHVQVGLYVPNPALARAVTRACAAHELHTRSFATADAAISALRARAIVACIAITSNFPHHIGMTMAGYNPLLDRIMAGMLIGVAADVSQHQPGGPQLQIANMRIARRELAMFMAASMVPFLIMILTALNGGLVWILDWEQGMLFRVLATPIPRLLVLVVRAAGSMLLTVLIATLACVLYSVITRPGLPLHMGAALIAVLCCALAANGVMTAVAALTRRFLLYSDICFLLSFVLMFLSGALVPIETLPPWERFVAFCTPTYYAIRLARAAFAGTEPLLLRDVLLLLCWSVAGYVVAYLHLRSARIDRRA